MKLINVKPSTYIDFNKKSHKEDYKFNVGGHVRISRYKSIFGKGYAANWFEEVFVIKKDKNTVLYY